MEAYAKKEREPTMHRSIVCSRHTIVCRQQTMRGWLLKSERAGSAGRFANDAPEDGRRQDTKKREPYSSLNHKSENIAVLNYSTIG